MSKGEKDTSSFILKKELGESANKVFMGTIKKKDGRDPLWFKKPLKSQQEALIECITGEIYRYIIGAFQSKIRTGGTMRLPKENRDRTVVLSEGVRYRSVRDIFDKTHAQEYERTMEMVKRLREFGMLESDANLDQELRDRHRDTSTLQSSIPGFKRAFYDQRAGFMRVLFSSIMMEENDLSDANYGLSIIGGEGANEQYGDFVKIDHGQSFNSMRIAESGSKKYAEVKYFSPPQGWSAVDRNGNAGIDSRTKSKRENMWAIPVLGSAKARCYQLSPLFIDRLVFDFLCGLITRDYIKGLHYQPSILPVFDGRLLTLLKDRYNDTDPSLWDAYEDAKYAAIAKLIFTNYGLYQRIAEHATSSMVGSHIQIKVRNKFRDNLDAMTAVMKTDPDFCIYCKENHELIQEDIRQSVHRMWHKRPKENQIENISDRYRSLELVNPLNLPLLDSFAGAGEKLIEHGQHLERPDFGMMARDFIHTVGQKIVSTQWEVGLFGGTKIRINEVNDERYIAGVRDKSMVALHDQHAEHRNAKAVSREVVVPDHVAQMALSLAMYDKSPRFRLFRTLVDILYIASDARKKVSKSRQTSTQQFYDWVCGDARTHFQEKSEIVSGWLSKYSEKNQGRYFDIV